jgi:Raf kinase inhibitor-like YbhB/YbcL family protein
MRSGGTIVNTTYTRKPSIGWIDVAAAVLALLGIGTALAGDGRGHMTLQSATFADRGTLPLSMINNAPNARGSNTCVANGAAGGNQSPQLTWTNAPDETRSFMVIVYDVTAQFTHWAMYNIPAGTTSLPENAGVPGSRYGLQNGSDFFSPSYGGPCPPKTFRPFVHEYKVTVYALDEFLPIVRTYGDFVPAGPEGLYQELIDASRDHHVLASASIRGFYSAVARANN